MIELVTSRDNRAPRPARPARTGIAAAAFRLDNRGGLKYSILDAAEVMPLPRPFEAWDFQKTIRYGRRRLQARDIQKKGCPAIFYLTVIDDLLLPADDRVVLPLGQSAGVEPVPRRLRRPVREIPDQQPPDRVGIHAGGRLNRDDGTAVGGARLHSGELRFPKPLPAPRGPADRLGGAESQQFHDCQLPLQLRPDSQFHVASLLVV